MPQSPASTGSIPQLFLDEQSIAGFDAGRDGDDAPVDRDDTQQRKIASTGSAAPSIGRVGGSFRTTSQVKLSGAKRIRITTTIHSSSKK